MDWKKIKGEFKEKHKRLTTVFRVARHVLSTFSDRKVGFQAVALSYWTFMSIIPFFSVIFFITGHLGIEGIDANTITDNFTEMFGESNGADFVSEKAEALLANADDSIAGFVSALMFFGFLIWMMFCVERVFNGIWHVSLSRAKRGMKRFLSYTGLIISSPFIILIFTILPIVRSNMFKYMGLDIKTIGILNTIVPWIAFLLISILAISMMYKFIPARKGLKYRNCLASATLSGTVFVLFQALYFGTQIFFSNMSAIFGILAAIPLFLMWMNISWQIILYGALVNWELETEAYENFPKEF